MQKKITFLLQEESINPVGGYKVVYTYAELFLKQGYDVTILYCFFPRKGFPAKLAFKMWLRKLVCFSLRCIGCRKQAWYMLDADIKTKTVFFLRKKHLSNTNVVIATAVSTAYDLNSLRLDSDLVKQLYFIQHFEDWDISAEEVFSSYRFPFKKICIAPWLVDLVQSTGQFADLVVNGFDPKEFFLLQPIEERCPSICFLVSNIAWKGTADAIAVLQHIEKEYPDIYIQCFGSCPRPSLLPQSFCYFQNPTHDQLVKLYNASSIFIGTSHYEGFGLTIGEAMLCGCAIACYRNGGFEVMVKDNDTGLLSSVGNLDALYENIRRLLDNDELRKRMAICGNQFIKMFDWNLSCDKFLEIIES